MTPKAAQTRIAQLKASEVEYTRMAAEATEQALAASGPSGYEKWSRRGLEMERIALKLAAERTQLETVR